MQNHSPFWWIFPLQLTPQRHPIYANNERKRYMFSSPFGGESAMGIRVYDPTSDERGSPKMNAPKDMVMLGEIRLNRLEAPSCTFQGAFFSPPVRWGVVRFCVSCPSSPPPPPSPPRPPRLCQTSTAIICAPLFLKVKPSNPSKRGLNSKQSKGHLGSKYIYIYTVNQVIFIMDPFSFLSDMSCVPSKRQKPPTFRGVVLATPNTYEPHLLAGQWRLKAMSFFGGNVDLLKVMMLLFTKVNHHQITIYIFTLGFQTPCEEVLGPQKHT